MYVKHWHLLVKSIELQRAKFAEPLLILSYDRYLELQFQFCIWEITEKFIYQLNPYPSKLILFSFCLQILRIHYFLSVTSVGCCGNG